MAVAFFSRSATKRGRGGGKGCATKERSKKIVFLNFLAIAKIKYLLLRTAYPDIYIVY